MDRKLKIPSNYLYHQLRSFLFSIEPEKVHERLLSFIEICSKFPGFIPLLRKKFDSENPILKTQLFFKTLNNPIGLAAGFDKDGRIIPSLFAIGFGFVEVGTVTLNPQVGNPYPRLFRLQEDQGIINRMGFNNQGAFKMVERFLENSSKIKLFDDKIYNLFQDNPAKLSTQMLGINIGLNKGTPLDHAAKDYVSVFKLLHPFAEYFTLNVSSPNTANLRDLQKKENLQILLNSVCEIRDKLDQNCSCKTPILLKLSPDMHEEILENCISVIKEFSIQGVIATNTTIKRQELKSHHKIEPGGLSGKPLQQLSTKMIRILFNQLGKDIPIIGVGGISNGSDAYEKIKAGASAVQIYTALIYEGPTLVKKVKSELAKLLELDGYKNIKEAIGVDK